MSAVPAVPAPVVSVILPTYNRPQFLPRALASAVGQTLRELEVIVVNDGGAPAEASMAALGEDPRVHYVRTGHNGKIAAARNVGLRLARGRYVAYLDDDDYYLPFHLETLVAELRRGPERVVYSDARRTHEERSDDGYVATRDDFPYGRDFDGTQLLLTNYIPVPCIVHERACLDDVGAFDETIPVLEDWDMWIRLSRRFPFRRVPTVTCVYSWREDGTSYSSRDRGLFKPWEKALFRKHGAWLQADPQARRALYEYRLKEARALVTGGKLEAAILIQKETVADDPTYAPGHFDLGALLLDAGLPADAARAFARASELEPASLEARLMHATALLRASDCRKALTLIEPLLSTHGSEPKVYAVAGDIAKALGQASDAALFYRRAVELDRARGG